MENGDKCNADENGDCQAIQDDRSTTENLSEETFIRNLQNEDVRKPERTADSLEEVYSSSNNINSLEVEKRKQSMTMKMINLQKMKTANQKKL